MMHQFNRSLDILLLSRNTHSPHDSISTISWKTITIPSRRIVPNTRYLLLCSSFFRGKIIATISALRRKLLQSYSSYRLRHWHPVGAHHRRPGCPQCALPSCSSHPAKNPTVSLDSRFLHWSLDHLGGLNFFFFWLCSAASWPLHRAAQTAELGVGVTPALITLLHDQRERGGGQGKERNSVSCFTFKVKARVTKTKKKKALHTWLYVFTVTAYNW